MAPDEEEKPVEEVIVDSGIKAGDQLSPDTVSNTDDLVDQKSVNPNTIIDLLIKNQVAMDAAVKHAQSNPKIIEAIITKLIQDRTMMKKTVTFGQMLAIAGITVPVSGVLGVIIGANLGAISAGLAAAGAGLAVAATPIGFVLAGLVGLVAIVALGFAAYKYRGQIKSGAEDIGKKLKDLLKNILDKLPFILTNAQVFYANVINEDAQNELNPQVNRLSDNAAFAGLCLSEDGLAALRQYMTDNKDANEEITLEDGSKLTLGDLNALETQIEHKLEEYKDGLIEVLKKFAPIMNEKNEGTRRGIEKIQAAIHTNQKRQTPLPGSPSRPNSIANNKLIKLIGEKNGDPKGIKDLLQLIAGDDPELKGGLNKDFREDFYEVLSGEPYKLDHETLYELERKGGEDLIKLATELSKLDDTMIKNLKEEVNKLKEKQAKGPRKNIGVSGASQAESPGQGQGV